MLALRGQGLDYRQIADRTGIAPKTVAALEHGAARRRKSEAEIGRAVLFDPRLLARLAPHAAARGIGANELARRIVETVEADGLVDAILDDREE